MSAIVVPGWLILVLRGLHAAKINPQVNHVCRGKGRKRWEGERGEEGIGNLLLSTHVRGCINELQVGNRGVGQVCNGVLLE